MRYVYAIIALVIAGVLLVLGVGQQTFLAGPDKIALDASLSSKATYAMISADTLDQVEGRPVIELRGTEPFAAVGARIDIEAWLAPFDHVVLTENNSGEALIAETVTAASPETLADETETEAVKPQEAAAAELLDPRGSDLWIEERSESLSVSLPVALQADQAVLIATTGIDPLPGKISVSWMQSQRAPLSGPFLVAGFIFGLAGAVLYLLAVDHDRRGLGPRRGRGGPLRGVRDLFSPDAWTKPKAKASKRTDDPNPAEFRVVRPKRWLAAIGLVGVLGLTGCSADYWPDLTPSPAITDPAASSEPTPDLAPVPVTDAQIDRIVKDIAKVANAADDELDAELLEKRFTSDALAQRAANYKIRQSVPDYQAPPRITDKRLDYELVQSTEKWPRTLFVMLESAADTPAAEAATPGEAAKGTAPTTPSLALILTQANPHENFLVTHVTEVRGGITMPPAAPAEEGTALLAEDLKTLRLTPDQVGDAYADILQNGDASEYAADFDLEGDLLLEKMGLAWAVSAQAEADAAGQKVTHSVSVTEGSETPVTLSTGEGGALISVVINDDLISASSDPQSKVKPTPSVTALSGITESQDRIVQHWTHQMLFFVPSADSGQLIRVLGSTSAMIGAES